MASIKCINGPEHRHESVEESRECWARVFGSNAPAVPRVTRPTPAPPAAVPYALQHRTTVPLAMLDATPDGRFAVRLDDKDAYRFLRISRRFSKTSKKLGCIQVQSQHSDDLHLIMLYRALDTPDARYPSEWIHVQRADWEKYVILAMVDPLGAGRRYAEELGECQICGRTLTDERSRHYGIGPECEKSHPDVIAYVDGLEEEEDDK